MTGKIHSIQAAGAASPARGLIQPDDGGPLLSFVVADTEDAQDGGVRTLAASDVGASVNYWYDGAAGLAKKVRFT